MPLSGLCKLTELKSCSVLGHSGRQTHSHFWFPNIYLYHIGNTVFCMSSDIHFRIIWIFHIWMILHFINKKQELLQIVYLFFMLVQVLEDFVWVWGWGQWNQPQVTTQSSITEVTKDYQDSSSFIAELCTTFWKWLEWMKCPLFSFVHTLLDLCSSYVLEGLVQIKFCTSQNWVCIWSTICVYTSESSWSSSSNSLEPISHSSL